MSKTWMILVIWPFVMSCSKKEDVAEPGAADIATVVGERLAELLHEQLNGQGSFVVMEPIRDRVEYPVIAPFLKAVEKYPGLHFITREQMLILGCGRGGQLSLRADDYKEFLAGYQNIDAVISFEGIPDPNGLAEWPDSDTALILFTLTCGKAAIEGVEEVLTLAVFPRKNDKSDGKVNFDRNFGVYKKTDKI
jgi:hypothetical protein